MDRNQGNQGGRSGSQGTTDSRGLGNMDEDQRRRAAQKGGETSSHEQGRDDQGQFTGTPGTGSIRGGLGDTRGGSQSGGQGGSHPGGQSEGHGNQGGSNR